MTTAQVVKTSVTVNNNSPIQDYVHPDDQTQPFKGSFISLAILPFVVYLIQIIFIRDCKKKSAMKTWWKPHWVYVPVVDIVSGLVSSNTS